VENPEISFFEQLLLEANGQGAADIILTVGAPPRAKRTHGLIDLSADFITSEEMQRMVDELVPERLRMTLASEGSVDFSRNCSDGRIRFNVFRQRGEWALVGRLVSKDIPVLESLGLPDTVKKILQRRQGLIILTGSTGSGKTTTLAAIIDYLNSRESLHIISIEDPIEYLHTNRRASVEQIEVGQDAPSFSAALRGNLRRAPDVIVIGEMRDQDSIQQALILAETGHLVLSTLHTDDSVHAIGRIADVFPREVQEQMFYLISQVLVAVITQALLPAKSGGGVVLASEILVVTQPVQRLIRERHPEQIYSVMQTAGAEGMYTLNDCLERLVLNGSISAEVAMCRSTQPKWLEQRLVAMQGKGDDRSKWFGKKQQ
jgi:twitching motility protein PilT